MGDGRGGEEDSSLAGDRVAGGSRSSRHSGVYSPFMDKEGTQDFC